MNDLRKAAEMALEALEDIFGKEKKDVGAINALRQALDDKPPVKSYCGGKANYCTPVDNLDISEECVQKTDKSIHEPLYMDMSQVPTGMPDWKPGMVFPAPKKEWVGLTPTEFNGIKDTATTIGYAITKTEAMLKEKNT